MKHKFIVMPKEEVLANRSNAYEFINFNKQNMKLISMTEFVLQRKKKMENDAQNHVIFSTSGNLTKIFNYANFLKQPLKLEMFVPCDEDGNVLEEPIDSIGGVELYSEKYKQAKEKVLFEGFTFKEETNDSYFLLDEGIYTHILNKIRPITIENLVGMDRLKLTESAIKQLG